MVLSRHSSYWRHTRGSLGLFRIVLRFEADWENLWGDADFVKDLVHTLLQHRVISVQLLQSEVLHRIAKAFFIGYFSDLVLLRLGTTNLRVEDGRNGNHRYGGDEIQKL